MPKNLIVFYTDQQRRDSLGCYGNRIAATPHLDALAGRGFRFNNHYAANPVCSPSRASFMTGRHLQAHRLIDNGIALPETEVTLPAALAANGYRTRSVGKLHLTPVISSAEYGHKESQVFWKTGALDHWDGPYYGFDDVRLVIGHGPACFVNGGHYGAWVRERFPELVASEERIQALYSAQHGRTPLPVEAHHSTYVADQSIEFLKENAERPFFLYASFPDPHHPFLSPDPFYGRFENADFPEPHRKEGENDRKPFHYRRAMTENVHCKDGGAHRPLDMTQDDWQKVLAATYGNVSLVDHSVGRVLECLKELGLDGNTTVAFTSDHGDFMGDHWFLYKGPYPCRSLLNVPFIVADPDCPPGVTDAVMSNVDAMPTLLDLLGVEIPECVQGRSFKDVMQVADSAHPEPASSRPEPVEGHAALVSGWSKDSPLCYHFSLYTPNHRITYFPNQDDGELYDLQADPFEFDNLYHEASHRTLRDELLLRLLKELGRAEPNYPPVVANW